MHASKVGLAAQAYIRATDVDHMTVQDVVVLGSGAFACEAMEAALNNNAKHVTIICRDRKR